MEDNDEEEKEDNDEEEESKRKIVRTKPALPEKDTTLGETTDKQILRGFLSGSTCLQGVCT